MTSEECASRETLRILARRIQHSSYTPLVAMSQVEWLTEDLVKLPREHLDELARATERECQQPLEPRTVRDASGLSEMSSGTQELMKLGREELMMREALVHQQVVVKENNNQRVELTTVELSYLHQQLQGITTTCTLIIGFAMASLAADFLRELGDSSGQFCLYKSPASIVVGGKWPGIRAPLHVASSWQGAQPDPSADFSRWTLCAFAAAIFIFLTTCCICTCFTIITCTQIIIFASQARCCVYVHVPVPVPVLVPAPVLVPVPALVLV